MWARKPSALAACSASQIREACQVQWRERAEALALGDEPMSVDRGDVSPPEVRLRVGSPWSHVSVFRVYTTFSRH